MHAILTHQVDRRLWHEDKSDKVQNDQYHDDYGKGAEGHYATQDVSY